MEKYTGNEKYTNAIKILPAFILIAICLLGIGYAALSSISFNITGTLGASLQKNVVISRVVDQSENEINGFYGGTILNSTIELDPNNTASTKTYSITVYNNSVNVYEYVSTICDTEDEEFYSNRDIKYTVTNIAQGDEILPGNSKTFQITFKYKEDITQITDNTLTSCIRFAFKGAINSFDLTETGNGNAFILGKEELEEDRKVVFNANNQTFYAHVDVNSITENATNENIITIGEHISEWTIPSNVPNGVNLHIYYPSPSDKKIIIAPLMQGEALIQFKVPYSISEDKGIIKIAFNSNGLYINEEEILDRNGIGPTTVVYSKQNTKTVEEYLAKFFNRWNTGNLTIQIGSKEGVNRSHAEYRAVEIYKQEMSDTELRKLTKPFETKPFEEVTYTEYLAAPYSPNGAKFMFDDQHYNNFEEQTLYTEIDISSITTNGSKDNILSVGHEIAEWTPVGANTADIHFYYPNDDGTLILAICLQTNGLKQWTIPMSLINATGGLLKIAINVNGIYINGVEIISEQAVNSGITRFSSTSGWNDTTFMQKTIERLISEGTLEIGSKQGDNQSYATYNKLRIYDETIPKEQLIRLTTIPNSTN